MARASAFQAEGRGFESRLPLHFFPTRTWLRQDSGDGQGGWRPLHAIWSLPELGCAKIQVTGKELRPLHPRSSAILLLLVILSLREFTSTCDFVLTAALLLPEYSLMRWCHK